MHGERLKLRTFGSDRHGERATAVTWRITCLILLLAASFHLATVAQAQTDYSFSDWLEARERLEREIAKTEAAELGISVEAILSVMSMPASRNDFVGNRDFSPLSDLKQFEKDKVEAAERGISIEAVLAARLERISGYRIDNFKDNAKREKEIAETKKRQAIALAVAATIAIVVIVIVFKARRWIAATISRRWRRKSKAFRVWAFGSVCWAMGTLLYVWLVEPYGSRMVGGEVLHMYSVIIVPPLFLGAMWFAYKRFVE